MLILGVLVGIPIYLLLCSKRFNNNVVGVLIVYLSPNSNLCELMKHALSCLKTSTHTRSHVYQMQSRNNSSCVDHLWPHACCAQHNVPIYHVLAVSCISCIFLPYRRALSSLLWERDCFRARAYMCTRFIIQNTCVCDTTVRSGPVGTERVQRSRSYFCVYYSTVCACIKQSHVRCTGK